jgi:crotonobetainyl-CoA:carnitine CoA-transferase CaiB-like acyl-CoA transferase
MDEVFSDPQVRPSRHGPADDAMHARGDIRLIAQPLEMSRTPPAIETTAPEAGEHTDEVLAEAGLSPDEIARLRAAGIV